MKFELKQFTENDYAEYKSWFDDARVKAALFYIDEKWLTHILNDKKGVEHTVFRGGELVAVVGILFPTEKHPSYGITNIAVNPKHFRTGIGSKVLKLLFKKYDLKADQYWLAFVDEKNTEAQSFFEKNGWIWIKNGEAGEGMMRYEMRCEV